MADLVTLKDAFDQFVTRAPAGSAFFGSKHLSTTGAPPRWVWVPRGGARSKAGSASGQGTNPRGFGCDEELVDIHCWGKDETQATRMRFAVTTALRDICGVGNFDRTRHESLYLDRAWTDNGHVIVATYTISVPHFAVSLTDFSDAPKREAVLENQDEPPLFDATGAVSGDGTITLGE